MGRIQHNQVMRSTRSGSAQPMLILLLPLVAAILLFIDPPPKFTPRPEPNAMQECLYGRLQEAGLEGDELATVGALTLGYKEDLSKELKHRFQASGAAHVLAVSGLHTGILYGVILWLLTLGRRYKPMHENRLGRWALSSVVIGAMWGYAWLTGMTPSVVRAVVMVTIFEVGRMSYRRAFSLNSIAAAAFLILVFRPTDLWSVSFQLSFAATAAIVSLARPLREGGEIGLPRPLHRGGEILSKVGAFFGGIIMVSLAAQIGTVPITAYYFGTFSTYFLITNLFVLPLATFLVPCGLISIGLGGSAAGVLFSRITGSLAWALNHSVGWIESWPGSTVPIHTNGVMIAVYYALLILFFVTLPKKEH